MGLGAAIVVLALMLVLYFLEVEIAKWMIITFPMAAFVICFLAALVPANTLVKEKITPFEHTLPSTDTEEAISTVGIPNKDFEEKTSESTREGIEKKKTELEKLKNLETYRKEFLGNVYHELKTPIFNIQGYILTLMEGGLDDPEINKLYLERTEQNINRLISVVDDLESISGLESGSLNLNNEKFNIKKIIREVFESNEIRAKKLNIRLETGRIKDSAEIVKADKKLIFQVLNNLVINADQAMPNGGTIEVTCKNTQIQEKDALPINEGDYVQVSIRDRGSGIPPAHLERIFEPYFSTKKHGSGLGLAVVYSIIQRHGGHIYVTSSPGSGSTFTFYLPASSTPLENQTSRIEAAPSGSGNILIMDDEPAVRQVAGNLLQYQGYNVAFAEDGAQAIEKYREAMGSPAPFDVVVMDLTVPGGMGGVDAIGQLLTLDSGAKVIVSSGYSQDPVMANFRKYGFCGVLVKPYRASSLSRLLQEILGSSPDSGSAE